MLEALAATSFLAVGLLGLMASTVTVTRTTKTSDGLAAANALAVQKLEQLRSMPLGAAQHASGNYADASNPLRADGTAGGVYTRTWTVSANNTPTFGVKTVIVTVAWQDSRAHTTRIAAYVRCQTIPCT